MNKSACIQLFTGFLLCIGNVSAHDNYRIEKIALPDDPDLNGQIDGLDFMPDGRLVACFPFGKVYTLDPETEQWTLFAEGLHNPLGIVAVDSETVIVGQRPEITRLVDEDGDGSADLFETVCDDFGMSGNYHEFHFGPARDQAGNLFSALGTASSGDGIRNEVRGDFYFNSPAYYNDPTISPEPFADMVNAFNRKRPGRMYSSVPYRGWIIKVSSDGEMTPWAYGLRTPNGIGFDLNGNLFCTDNQGDWVGSSKLFHIKKGRFYGHAASQVWTKGFRGHPLATSVADLDARRSRACVVFPQGSMANSPTQPLVDSTGGKFGPFAGQLLVGEMNKSRVMRIMLEEVGGELQGACIPFLDGGGLSSGNNRLAFDRKGRLWVGHTKHTWAGSSGLQRVTWTGETPFEVKAMTLNRSGRGFDLEFTVPVDETTLKTEYFQIRRYYYTYHEAYGSSQKDVVNMEVDRINKTADLTRISLQTGDMKPWHLYELNIKGLRSKDGRALKNHFMVYTLNRLHGNTPPPPVNQRGASRARSVARVTPWGKMSGQQSESGKTRKNPAPGIYEAEDAELVGVRRSHSNPGWYGSGFADFAKPADERITWQIEVEAAGTYVLKFRYALGGSARRPLELAIAGKSIGTPLPFASTGNWGTWNEECVDITLAKGRHMVTLSSIGESGPNIDSLQVVKK